MKKLAISAVLAMAVSAAHALTFIWNLGPGSLEALDNVTSMPIGTAVYLVWDADGDGFDGFDQGGIVTGGDVLMQTTSLSMAGGRSNQTITFTDGQSYTTGSGGSANLVAGASASMLLVSVATFDGTLHWNDSTIRTLAMTPASGSPATTYSFADATMIGGLDTGSGGWTPVPEPTTMALVGLGAAAAALRKRFMKK